MARDAASPPRIVLGVIDHVICQLRRIQSKSAKAWQPSDAGPVHRRRAGRRVVLGLPFALWRVLPRAHRPQRLPGQPCSQQELEFGDLCTGDATCGDVDRCYVAAADGRGPTTPTRRRALRRTGHRRTGRRRRGANSNHATGASSSPSSSVRGPRARPGRRGGRARVPAGARAPAAARPRRHVLRRGPRRGGLLLPPPPPEWREPGQGAARARRRRPTHARARLPGASRRRPRRCRTRSSTSPGHGVAVKISTRPRPPRPVRRRRRRVVRRRPPEVGSEAPKAGGGGADSGVRRHEDREQVPAMVGRGRRLGRRRRRRLGHGDERRRVHAPDSEEPARPVAEAALTRRVPVLRGELARGRGQLRDVGVVANSRGAPDGPVQRALAGVLLEGPPPRRRRRRGPRFCGDAQDGARRRRNGGLALGGGGAAARSSAARFTILAMRCRASARRRSSSLTPAAAATTAAAAASARRMLRGPAPALSRRPASRSHLQGPPASSAK